MSFPVISASTPGNASAAFQSACAAAGLNVNTLPGLAQLQLAVANLMLADPSTVQIPAGDVTSGTFGSNAGPDTGNYYFPAVFGSQTATTTPSALAATTCYVFAGTVAGAALMGFGSTWDVGLKGRAGTTIAGVLANTSTFGITAAGALAIGTPQAGAVITNVGSVTATGGVAYGKYSAATLVAAANNDVLTSISITPTATPGSFTGLVSQGLAIAAFSVAGFTTPGDPVGISIGIITGTGATNAYALRLGIPTGASTNYLIAASTTNTFNVTAAGALTLASSVTAGGNVQAGAANSMLWNGRSRLTAPADGTVAFQANGSTPITTMAYGVSQAAGSRQVVQKAISGIADNTFTDMYTVTVPNAAHAGTVALTLSGAKGAGDAEGADGSVSSVTYLISIQRTSGVATTAAISSAVGSVATTIAAGNAVTTTAQCSAMTGATSATQTFTIQVKVARAAGSSTNHTCFGTAQLLNANATGISIA